MNMPVELTHWTADEIAECLSVGRDLYVRLYEIKSEANNPTPVWTQYPEYRIGSEFDDKTPHFWTKLTTEEQSIIVNELKNQ